MRNDKNREVFCVCLRAVGQSCGEKLEKYEKLLEKHWIRIEMKTK